LGIYQQLSNNLLAVPSDCPITFKSISQRLLAKTGQFLSIFPVGPSFYEHLLKVEEALENFKNLQQLLS
jgi:hypothetical protein